MQRKWTVYSLALGIALGSTSNLPAQAPNFTTIDFPGAKVTSPGASNARGDIVGGYTLPDGTRHGFLWSGGSFTTIDYPMPTYPAK